MWIAEFKVWHEGSPLLPFSKKMDIHLMGSYLNTYHENGIMKVMRIARFWGKEKEKAIRGMLEIPSTQLVAREGDQMVFCQTASTPFHSLVMDRNVFFVAPIIEEYGFQWWKVGSHTKENLLRFFRKLSKDKKKVHIELLGIYKGKLNMVQQLSLGDLPERDLHWIQSAVKEGYYSFPRKISLENLALKLGVPYATLKRHIRKSEAAIIQRSIKSESDHMVTPK